MNAPVVRTTIHHAGGGVPNDGVWDNSDAYCVLIGVTRFTVVQSPFTAWATKGFNHVSFDICFSGNRMVQPVTDNDLHLIEAACSYARSHGWLAADAVTFPHGTLHPPPPRYPTGSSPTDCPGILAIDRWPSIVQATVPVNGTHPPGDDDVPADSDIVAAYANAEGAWELEYGGGVRTVRGPFYGSYFTLPASARNDPTRRFRAITAPMNGAARGYTLASVKGEPYNFNTPQ
jgi:hypothetical protein